MTVEQRAEEIAAKANKCCDRSDGYEKEIYELALKHLKAACDETLERANEEF